MHHFNCRTVRLYWEDYNNIDRALQKFLTSLQNAIETIQTQGSGLTLTGIKAARLHVQQVPLSAGAAAITTQEEHEIMSYIPKSSALRGNAFITTPLASCFYKAVTMGLMPERGNVAEEDYAMHVIENVQHYFGSKGKYNIMIHLLT